jgi:hypothetical protein
MKRAGTPRSGPLGRSARIAGASLQGIQLGVQLREEGAAGAVLSVGELVGIFPQVVELSLAAGVPHEDAPPGPNGPVVRPFVLGGVVLHQEAAAPIARGRRCDAQEREERSAVDEGGGGNPTEFGKRRREVVVQDHVT